MSVPTPLVVGSTEHLEAEETLLIHWSLSCTGYWDLMQIHCGYRNVCDTDWTIMYPNIQHPRHTDFPIQVGAGVKVGTFAWNYAGVRGVEPSSFDPGHSYLVQLTVFEQWGCQPAGATGEPPVQPTGTEPTGSMVVGPTPKPGVTGTNPVGGSKLPFHPGPPWPHPRFPGRDSDGPRGAPIPGHGGCPAGCSGIPPDPPSGEFHGVAPLPGGQGFVEVPATVPLNLLDRVQEPRQPQTLDVVSEHGERPIRSEDVPQSVGYIGRIIPEEPQYGVSVSFGLPVGTEGSQFTSVFTRDPADPTVSSPVPTIEPTLINLYGWESSESVGKSQSSVFVEIGQTYIPQTGISLARTEGQVGEPLVDPVRYSPSVSQSVEHTVQTQYHDITPGTETRLTQSSQSVIGQGEQPSASRIKPTEISSTESLVQISEEHILPGATVMVETFKEEIPQGSPGTVSATFQPPHPVEVEAGGELFVITKGAQVYKVGSTPIRTVSHGNPLVITEVLRTNEYPPGSLTVVFRAKDTLGKVIGVGAKRTHIVSSEGKNFAGQSVSPKSEHREGSLDVPAALSNLLDLGQEYLPANLNPIQGGMCSYILRKNPNRPPEFSAIVIGDRTYEAGVEARIRVHGATEYTEKAKWEYAEGSAPPIEIGLPLHTPLVYDNLIAESSERAVLDGEPFMPRSHIAALCKTAVDTGELLVTVSVGGEQHGEVIGSRVCFSNNYRLRPSHGIGVPDSTTTMTLTGQIPLANTPIKLYVNGRQQATFTSDPVYYNDVTTAKGNFSFTGVTMTVEDYVTVLYPGMGNFNLMNDIVAEFQVAKTGVSMEVIERLSKE